MPYPSSFSDLVAEEKYCSGYGGSSLSNGYASDVGIVHSSEFSAGECGEPMLSQRLSIDFTPVPGVDDDSFLVKKCLDFWVFVRQQPELRNLMVEPIEEIVPAESVSTVSEPPLDIPTPPAVQWLENEAGQPSAFANKPEDKYCDTYGLEDLTSIDTSPPNTDLMKHSHQENLSQEAKMKRKRKHLQPEVAALCKQLQEWDKRHPKCMDPPGPVPTLVYSKMHRSRY